jgi:hypothetical protein
MSDDFTIDPTDKKLRGIDLLAPLADALGIKHPVRRIKLDIGLYDVATVVVESIVRNEQGKRIAKVLTEEFDLVKRSEFVSDVKANPSHTKSREIEFHERQADLLQEFILISNEQLRAMKEFQQARLNNADPVEPADLA